MASSLRDDAHTAVYLFGPFRLDSAQRRLTRHGAEVDLTPIVLDALLFMVRNPGRIITKAELLDALWPDRIVEETNVRQTVFTLRKSLGEDGVRLISTAPGRGYRFAGPVQEEIALPELDAAFERAAPPPRTPARWWVWSVTAGAVVVAAAACLAGWLWQTGDHGRPATIVLADFDNQTHDTIFDNSLGNLVRVDLGQSPTITVLTDRQVQETFSLMTRPKDTPLKGDVLSEVCTRNNADAFVQGQITAMGQGFLLTLSADDCSGTRVLAEEKAEVASRDAVPQALDQLIGQLRHHLGESAANIEKFSVPLVGERTASLDALKAYSEAKWLFDHGKMADAIPLDQHAIALDPHFAAAHASLGVIYLGSFDPVRGQSEIGKAYADRDTLNEHERFRVISLYDQFVLKDFLAAIRDLKAWTDIYPRDPVAWSNLANAESFLGRYAPAIAAAEHAVSLNPGIESPYVVLARSKLASGDYKGALAVTDDATAKNLSGPATHRERLRIAIASGDLAGIGREEAWAKGQSVPAIVAAEAEYELSRGHVDAASHLFDLLGPQTAEQGTSNFINPDRARLIAALGYEDAARVLLTPPIDEHDPDYLIAFAQVGDPEEVRNTLDKRGTENTSDTLMTGMFVPVARSTLALRQNQARQAVADLAPAAIYASRNFDVPYALGNADLAAGDAAGAEAAFRMIIDHKGWHPESEFYPLAQLGLARALVLAHDPAAARKAYQSFFRDWASADKTVPILNAARSEYAKL